MRRLFAGCLAAFWLQFAINLAAKTSRATEPEPAEPSALDQAQIDAIMARCKATTVQPDEAHSPEIVARWIEFVDQHNLPIIIVRRNQAIVPSLTPAPRRVH